MFARWLLPKAVKKGAEVIKSVKSGTKFPGQKTVQQVQNAASAARASGASFNYKAGIGKAMRKMKDIK